MGRVMVEPAMLRWARERSGLPESQLSSRFRKLPQWEQGLEAPTLRQLEAFAKATSTPLGYLFLPSPEEPLPVPDFRTMDDAAPGRPRPNLLETLQAMQRRQDWMRDHLDEEGIRPLDFVGAVSVGDDPRSTADRMRARLGFARDWASGESTWSDALRKLRVAMEDAGVLVVINGVVGNNTHRRLDPDEFRGFVLADDLAPLVFVNGADGRAAQMFTLAHELAHVWLGQPALFRLPELQPDNVDVERFCNRVAAEFLVPEDSLRTLWPELVGSPEPVEAVARHFKVSSIVAARRALDLGLVSKAVFRDLYRQSRERERRQPSAGGNFYASQDARIGRRFATALIRAAREGQLLYRNAYELCGLSGRAFDRYARNLGFRVPA